MKRALARRLLVFRNGPTRKSIIQSHNYYLTTSRRATCGSDSRGLRAIPGAGPSPPVRRGQAVRSVSGPSPSRATATTGHSNPVSTIAGSLSDNISAYRQLVSLSPAADPSCRSCWHRHCRRQREAHDRNFAASWWGEGFRRSGSFFSCRRECVFAGLKPR